jgi:predicted RNA-binding protein YlxR (DUF448 family)
VGCRQRAAKSKLVRVVAVESVLQADPAGRLPGRGAHLHPTGDCLTSAVRRKAFARALRLPGPFDATPVEEYVAHQPGANLRREGGTTR